MGRGDRPTIRWSHDRQRKLKDRRLRAAKARGVARRAAKKK